MTHASFTVFYDGPAMQRKEIDARDFANLLIATADLLEIANLELKSTVVPIRVRVSEIRRESLEFFFDLVPLVYDSAVDVLTSKDLTALRTLIEILFGANGLIWLIKKLGRRQKHHNEQVRELESQPTEAFRHQRVARLLQIPEIRAAVSQFINKPLTKMDIQVFEARQNGKSLVVVKKDDAGFFSRDNLDYLAVQVQILADTSTPHPTEEPDTGMSNGNHERDPFLGPGS